MTDANFYPPRDMTESPPQASSSGFIRVAEHRTESSNRGDALPVTPEEDEAWNKMGALE